MPNQLSLNGLEERFHHPHCTTPNRDKTIKFYFQIVCVLFDLAVLFLEFVQFSSSLVGGAVALLACGMLAREKLFVMLGLSLYLGPVW